jgi:hypothetical protein
VAGDGCAGVLTAVVVAVRDAAGPSAPETGSQARAINLRVLGAWFARAAVGNRCGATGCRCIITGRHGLWPDGGEPSEAAVAGCEMGMGIRFNPPPNWPAPPPGWVPPPLWRPSPEWPAPPSGWQLWIDDTAPAPSRAVDLGPASPLQTEARHRRTTVMDGAAGTGPITAPVDSSRLDAPPSDTVMQGAVASPPCSL